MHRRVSNLTPLVCIGARISNLLVAPRSVVVIRFPPFHHIRHNISKGQLASVVEHLSPLGSAGADSKRGA